MRWVGLGGGYVSDDGRFFVAPVTVSGRRGPQKRWALYGRVHVRSEDPLAAPWRWSDAPIYGPADKKRDCQTWAASSDYDPPAVDTDAGEGVAATPYRFSLHACKECNVDFLPKPGHRYGVYCGRNCYEDARDEIAEIQKALAARRSA